MNINNKTEIMLVADNISKIIPSFCGVTLGGSRSHNHDDDLSDVEMYFYSTTSIPKLEDIDNCLLSMGARHKRSDSFLWNEYPWGPHSFFVFNDLYFEIGYRIISEVKKKLDLYMKGQVEPTKDCHDLGFGYVYSGLASSVCSEQILIQKGDEIAKLKEYANIFPDSLLNSLKREYLDTVNSLLLGKMKCAVKRNDVFLYDILASRVIRSLMIIAFACSKTHFPGDKWNEVLLLNTKWEKKDQFIKLIKRHGELNSFDQNDIKIKYDILIATYSLVKGELK